MRRRNRCVRRGVVVSYPRVPRSNRDDVATLQAVGGGRGDSQPQRPTSLLASTIAVVAVPSSGPGRSTAKPLGAPGPGALLDARDVAGVTWPASFPHDQVARGQADPGAVRDWRGQTIRGGRGRSGCSQAGVCPFDHESPVGTLTPDGDTFHTDEISPSLQAVPAPRLR